MKRALPWILAAAVFAGGALFALFALTRGAMRRQPLPLTIHFTCDLRGRLVPCGCFSGQMGGLTRIATILEDQTGPGVLKVDVGDALAGTTDYEIIQYRYLLKALGELGFAAANIGQREAAIGAEQLRALAKQSPVPLISANLLDTGTGAPLLPTHLILDRKGWRIAVIGALDQPDTTQSTGAGLRVEKIETTLGRLLPQLKGKADAIVLLAFANEEKLRALARDFYEVNVILGGKVSQPAQRLEHENRSEILYVTNQSRALGSFTARLVAPSKLEGSQGEVQLVSERIPQSRRVSDLAGAYRQEIRGTKLEIDDPEKLSADLVPGIKANASFAGSAACAGCHSSAEKAWHTSRHAAAFRSLMETKADADPNCIGCHTVGFGTMSGYRREYGETKLTDVGCESCHGPGSVHIAARQSGQADTGKMRSLGAGDCIKCHHGEFSRPFAWEEFWPEVRHGKENAVQAK